MSEQGPPSAAGRVEFRPVAERYPSTIRLRRIRSLEAPPPLAAAQRQPEPGPPPAPVAAPPATSRSRPRASTVSDRPSLDEPAYGRLSALPQIPAPGRVRRVTDPGGPVQPVRPGPTVTQEPGAVTGPRRKKSGFFNGFSFRQRRYRGEDPAPPPEFEYYDPKIVDMLDVIDPEVATLSSITNVQNSLFIPSLGRYVNRQPIFDLGPVPMLPLSPPGGAAAEPPDSDSPTWEETEETREGRMGRRASARSGSLLYDVGERYAVLPKGVSLDGWTEEEVAQLNDLVRHMLHSRRSGLKRSLKAFGKYVRKPLGFLVTLYGFLITIFGLAWVLFLIGWIYVGDNNRQRYLINVIDFVLVALFAIVGDGMAPFRAIDTYHMIYIAYYYRLTWKLRNKMDLPDLQDRNDLPTEFPPTADGQGRRDVDVELGLQDAAPEPQATELGTHQPDHERIVLTPKQQANLIHHQAKLSKSHTFYKPHETETHRAFPLNFLMAIVLLLDLHSCLQIALGACTWGINYLVRPMALTATILCCSITANVTAGVLISIGDHRTRKKEVVESLFRQELTETALKKMRKQREKERESMDRIREEGEREKGKRSEDRGRFSTSLDGQVYRESVERGR